MTTYTETTNFQKIYSPLIKILSKIDNLYTRKSEFEDPEITKEIVSICLTASELISKVKKAAENEIIIELESIELIENLLENTKYYFPNFISNFNGKEKLFFMVFKVLLTKEDWNSVEVSDYSNLKFLALDYIDKKGFNNFNKNDDYKNCLLVLPPMNLESEIKTFLNNIENLDILYSLLFSMDFEETMPEGVNLALIGENFNVEMNQLAAYIRLKKVSEGEILHNDYIYDKEVQLGSKTNWNIEKPYHQFDEIINVLSEYNQQKQILDKFLKIYQVIENFKYRSKIANLIDEFGEKMFSIRRFKTFYTQIESSEQKELKKLIENILSLDDGTGKTIKKMLEDDWNLFKNGRSIEALKSELIIIGCDTDPSITPAFLTNCIYSLRNSIAHNKETEIHLTHGVLNEYLLIKEMLSEFLLGALEKIVYSLMIEDSFIWYSQSKFLLYK